MPEVLLTVIDYLNVLLLLHFCCKKCTRSVDRFVQKEMKRTEQYSKRYRKLVGTLETLQK